MSMNDAGASKEKFPSELNSAEGATELLKRVLHHYWQRSVRWEAVREEPVLYRAFHLVVLFEMHDFF